MFYAFGERSHFLRHFRYFQLLLYNFLIVLFIDLLFDLGRGLLRVPEAVNLDVYPGRLLLIGLIKRVPQ